MIFLFLNSDVNPVIAMFCFYFELRALFGPAPKIPNHVCPFKYYLFWVNKTGINLPVLTQLFKTDLKNHINEKISPSPSGY